MCICSSCSRVKASTIQYGYMKCGTHARVFSQTLAHWNSKNEVRQKKKVRKERGASMEIKSVAGTKYKKVPTAYHYLIKMQ